MEIRKIGIILFFSGMISCATQTSNLSTSNTANDLFIVDCLLPGQVRKLGQLATYVTARRAIKTSAGDCEIRGGEYVAYDRANYLTALNIWMPKAQSGDPQAQNYVGEIYEKGLGIQPDYEMAYLWYKKAAKQGDSKAQMNLGFLYERGLGVEKNKAIAMEWYGRSSGLGELNIPYATTLSSEQDSNEISTELKLLKSDLKNSRAEAEILKNKLLEMQDALTSSKSKLVLLQQDFSQVNSKINDESNASGDFQKIAILKQTLNKKTQEIEYQKSSVESLENEYNKKIEVLTEKLADTKKRTEQIVTELKKENNDAVQSQVALLETETKLAETEKRLLEAHDLSGQRFKELSTIKQNSGINNESLQQAKNKLEIIQQQVLDYKKEKINNQQTIARLQTENQQIKKVEQDIKRQMLSDKLSEKKTTELSYKLQQQEQLAAQTQHDLLRTQNKLNQTEQEQSRLVSLSEKQLEKVEQEKLLLASQVASDKELKQKYIQDISNKTKQVDELRNKLIAEKKRYESRIKKLQQSVKVELTTDKPKIEIIAPPFVLTRGKPTVTLRSVVSQCEIIGKIIAPAGLLSLSINDKKNAINERGVFKTDIKMLGNKTPVQVVAVDNNGAKSSLSFVLSMEGAIKRSKNTQTTNDVKSEKNWESLNFGKYHALIIANNDYQKVPKLETPEADGRAVEKVLRTQYGFKTKLLLNGTRYQILSELNKFRAKLTEEDNLLIYYAGHGELDQVNMRGHWLPVDADGDNTANWISTVAITDVLNAMSVKHIMVVSDSCYSGAMTRSSLARLDAGVSNRQRNDWLKAMLKTRSRTVLTSGGLKPVMDGGGGKHSVFANAFIKALENNDKLLEGQALYRRVSNNIVAIAADYGIEQVPEYAPIRHAGHESGEFFFVPE